MAEPNSCCSISPPTANVDRQLVGLEYVPLLQEHLDRLHRHRNHPNRTLHDDTLLVTLLLGFYESTNRSLRKMEDLGQCEQVRRYLPVDRVPRSTLSDALSSCDPKVFLPIIQSFMKRLPKLKYVDGDLASLHKRILAADGSIFTVPADVAWAISLTRRGGREGRQIRLNLVLDTLHFVPASLDLSGAGDGSEATAFKRQLIHDGIYLFDRGFVDFSFLHAVLDTGSDFVARLKKDTVFTAIEERPLIEADHAAHVISDRIGHVPGSRPSPGFGDRPMRQVIIIDTRNNKLVRLLTTLLDVPAHVIGKLYRHRWAIELFFRWLKCIAKYEHLFSHSANGITVQFYVAVIGILLTYLRTGQRPGVYEFACLSWVARNMMSVETMHSVLARRQRERDLEKARRLKKQAAPKSA